MGRHKFNILYIAFSVCILITSSEEITSENSTDEASGLDTRSVHHAYTKRKDGTDLYTNKKTYLKRFSQSWKYYAKANDIAKREKLRKALLDALRSMNNKKKTTVTSLTHDSVERIQHAARMLKEFKRMYKLSNDVLSSWKDYSSARKNLLNIGQTKEGNDILKKYVILRDKVVDHMKRSEIARPTIVDDQDIDVNIAKDNIARHGQELKLGSMIIQRAMTPGTLQIIRSPSKERQAHKRMNLLSDAKEAARTAYNKAKEAISALKEKLKGVSSAQEEKVEAERKTDNGTSDKGTSKKSLLAESNEVKGESLGHVNVEMALTGMIKKAEKADLNTLNKATAKDDEHRQPPVSAKYLQSKPGEKGSGMAVDERSDKKNNDSFHAIMNGAQEKQKLVAQKNDTKVAPTTSISSLMDSLGGGEEGGDNTTKSLSGGSENLLVKAASKSASNASEAHTNPLVAGPSSKTEAEKLKPNVSVAFVGNTSAKNSTDIANNTMQPIASESNNTSKGNPDRKLTKLVLMSSQTAEQKIVKVSRTPFANDGGNETATREHEVASNNTNSSASGGSKRFHLNEVQLQEEAVKTIDRQLETLKRLKEAKRARKRYDSAKHELQNKIKSLYDMAVSFEKPINAALMSTKTNIDPNPVKSDHPGAALAGLSEKPVLVVKTPSDDSEQHGFTLGAMDTKALSKAHIVDLNEDKEKPIEKAYQLDLGKSDASAEKKSGNGDHALKSLTEAIKNDLRKIEMNQREQEKAKHHSDEMKQALEPIITEMKNAKEKMQTESIEKATPETVLQALGNKKDKQEDTPNEEKADPAAKAQDAFKEVEDYLSKALKHVAKEAISEEASSDKDTEIKEASELINDETSTKAKSEFSPTASVKNASPTSVGKGNIESKEKAHQGLDKEEKSTNAKKDAGEREAKEKEAREKEMNEKEAKEKEEKEAKEREAKENKEKEAKGKGDANQKEKDIDKNERLRKIVEDAMKEHAKDPLNPHPINADLLKPAAKSKEEATTAKAVKDATKEGKDLPEEKSKPTESASASASASASTPTDATIQRSPNDAIGKAEHLEEQVAKLQDKLYSQGSNPSSTNDAYKTIDNVEDKPLFSQDATPGDQPVYQEHEHHHSHRRHHHAPDQAEEEDDRGGYDRDYDDDDEDDGDYDDDEEEQREDYDDDDEEDRKRKKSFLQPDSWRQPYRNYQRDRILSKQMEPPVQHQQPLMDSGMMGDEERDELEDTKKSSVPRATGLRHRLMPIKGNKMYIL